MADSSLAVRAFGTGPPLIALHGFTLTGEQFAPFADHLERTIIAPDLPGHGGSATEHMPVVALVAALAAITSATGAPVPVLGYSMGGRVALSLALDRPEMVERIIVVSGSAGIEDPEGRSARVTQDRELANRITTEGVGTFLDEWLGRPLTSTASVEEAARCADRAVREENSADGLAAALVGLGQGAYPYLGDRLAGLQVALLAVSGGADERYTEQAATLAASVPDGRHEAIPGAGHNVVLQAPGALATVLEGFLRE